MNQYEHKKVALEKAMKEHVDAFQAIYAKAREEKREVDNDERLEIESHVKALETLKDERRDNDENLATVQRVQDIGRELGPALGRRTPREGGRRALGPGVQVDGRDVHRVGRTTRTWSPTTSRPAAVSARAPRPARCPWR